MTPNTLKALKLTLKTFAGIGVVLLVCLLLLIWRLSSGPIQLNQFVPGIEQAASNLPGGLSVRLQGIGLFWDQDEREIDLRALNVELIESSGSSLVSAPEVNISISFFALMRGVVALSSAELEDVQVKLVRREDGTFQVFKKADNQSAPAGAESPADFSKTVQHVFKILAQEGNTQTPLSYLKELKVSGSLEVEDRKTGLRWAADAVESLFVGITGKVEGDMGVTFSSPQALAGTHANISLSLKDDAISAELDFDGIRPGKLAGLDPALAALAGLDMGFEGTIRTSLTLPDTIHSLSASIKGGPGQVSYQDIFPAPLKANSLRLQLKADVPARSLQLSALDVELGDAEKPLKLHLNGTAKVLGNSVSMELEAGLQQLKVSEFDLYWPKSFAPGTRQWLVNNLRAGTVGNAGMDIAMVVPRGPDAGFQLDKLEGTVAYNDLTVAYYGSLPPATGVSGAGTFDLKGFDLDVSQGLVNGVQIERGKVIISDMDNEKTAISVKTNLNGPLPAVVAVFEAAPINFRIDAVSGKVSEKLGGQVEGDFSIAVPLKPGPDAGEVHYEASGKISEGTFSKILRDHDLHSAHIDFTLDQSKVNFRGPLAFSGIPLTLDWTSTLAGPDKGHADFTVNSTEISAGQISALGYDVSEYMKGSISLKTTANLAPGGPVNAVIESDLTNAALAIPRIHWDKAAGEQGKMDFSLMLEKNHLHASDINLELGRLVTSGNAEFDIEGPVAGLTLEHLTLPHAQLNGLKLEHTASKSLRFSVQGGEVSLEPFLSGDSEQVGQQEKRVAAQLDAIVDQLDSKGITVEIGKSRLDKVHISQDTYFENVRFSGRRDSNGWNEVMLSGHNPFADGGSDADVPAGTGQKLGSGQFRLAFGPPADNRYPVHLEAQDLGSLVSAFKGRNVMKGGYLVLSGESTGPLFKQPVKANIELDRFTLKEAPAISKVLNLASLTQIFSTLTNTGLAFNSASGDIELDGPRLTTQQIRMSGGSLGMRLSGWMDLQQQDMEVHGTIVPMNNINFLVGKIPVLGQVLVGPDGKGIMAFDYTIKGSINKPDASVREEKLTPTLLKETTGEDIEDAATGKEQP